MEKRLNVTSRWLPGSDEWKVAAEKVSVRQYQRCLDTLEGLVVARMFELTRMNMSQTGKLASPQCTWRINLHSLQAITFGSILAMP